MPDWFPGWTGESCVIVAAGPSAPDAFLEPAKGKAKVIVINRSWRLAPWADVLYGCDERWWRSENGVPDFHGLKVSQDLRAFQKREWNIKLVRTDRSCGNLIRKPLGRLAWGGTGGGNGGFQAINLAVQFGASRLLLVGFDMRIDLGVHWHGKHERGMNNPSKTTVEKWRAHLDGQAARLKELGVEVINCSLVSALTAYPKMSLEEALRSNAEGVAAAAA